MELKLERFEKKEQYTGGKLYLNGEFFCYTLEDTVRELNVKIPGKTAIPFGTYKIKVSYSPAFKCSMPELLDVPNFKGIRIHWGNYTKDTNGCILVGERLNYGILENSKSIYLKLFDKIHNAFLNEEDIKIEIQ